MGKKHHSIHRENTKKNYNTKKKEKNIISS